MRLIDADALLEKTHNYYPSIDHYYCSRKVVETRDIINAPTIEAEPVKHGRWEDLREAYNDVPLSRCSLCGREIIGLESSYNYCPNCGAKMDLEGT